MKTDEKRRSHRIGSLNLISYTCVDENNRNITQGMGRTLNVSESGILLETHVRIDPRYKISFTVALEDEIMDFDGRVAHTQHRRDGMFETGIAFEAMDPKKLGFLRQLIAMFGSLEI